MVSDKCCLSYWFPEIEKAGLSVPATRIVQTEIELISLLDGKTPPGFIEFIQEIAAAVEELGGYPFFLRTGHGSGKHEWQETCFVSGIQDTIGLHVCRLVDWSSVIDLAGLPTRIWVVRELLRTRAAFYAFKGMPITREFRIFTRGGRAVCVHPYWTPDSIRHPTLPDWYERLRVISSFSPSEANELRSLAERAVAALDYGSWSVDFLQDVDGKWWLIDMAPASRSFHWPSCKEALDNDG